MRNLFSFIILLLLLWACNGQPKETDSTDSTTTENPMPVNTDSIRKVYEARMLVRKDPMPIKQVYEKGKLNPVDEAPLDTAFFLLREELVSAIKRKDIFTVLKHTDKNIKCSFGAENGIEGLIKIWELDTPEKTKKSRLWEVLGKVLNQGGVFSDKMRFFTAPFYYETFPDQYDAFEYGLINARGVRLRNAPGLSSRKVNSLSYDIVKILEVTEIVDEIQGEEHPWVKVALLDGTEGFIYGKFVASPIDFRAGFEKKADGNWKMVFFVAGD